MNVDQIPSDVIIEMTEIMHRTFNAAGCDPMCHCCNNMLPIGVNFKLSTIVIAPVKWGESAYFQKEILLGNLKPLPKDYAKFFNYIIRKEFEAFDKKNLKEGAAKFELESKEVMLCADCTPETFMLKELECIEKEIIRIEAPKGGCFRVNGKIVT